MLEVKGSSTSSGKLIEKTTVLNKKKEKVRCIWKISRSQETQKSRRTKGIRSSSGKKMDSAESMVHTNYDSW